MSGEVEPDISPQRQGPGPHVEQTLVDLPHGSCRASSLSGSPEFMNRCANTGHHAWDSSTSTTWGPDSRPEPPGNESFDSQQTIDNPRRSSSSQRKRDHPIHRVDPPSELDSVPQKAGPASPGNAPPGYQPIGSPSSPGPEGSGKNLLLRYCQPHYTMYFFLLAGVAFAIGHDFFYRTLDGKEATDQIRLFRYGSALSFLSKASLAAAAGIAFQQCVWITVKRKMLTLAAVDSLFAAREDVSSFFCLELFGQAKLATLLAVYVWCTPLVVIFSSQTLAVESMTVTEDVLCPSVRSLDFNQEGHHDWRSPKYIDDVTRLSLSYWNMTSADEPDSFDYYTGASQPLEQLTTLSALRGKIIERENASAEICEPGWNYTITIDFVAPGYKCTELASGVNSRPKNLGDAVPPFGTDVLLPTGNFSYITSAFEGEYAVPQVSSGPGGIPQGPPPYPENLGALRTEPVIWIGYASAEDPSKPRPESWDDQQWEVVSTPKIVGCEHYETKYEVEFTYIAPIEHIRVKKRDYLRPVIDTVFLRGELAEDGTLDNTTATPSSNYVLPSDTERYKTVSAYHSLGLQLRNVLNGTIAEPMGITTTDFSRTKLLNPRSLLAASDLQETVPELYEDMLLSFLSDPRLLPVVWAADTKRDPGTVTSAEETNYPCTRHRTSNLYQYHSGLLWTVYSVAIFLCVLAVMYGTYVVLGEGATRTTKFSSIAAAARGPALEKVPLPGDPLQARAREAEKLKLGYGFVASKGGPGFGVEGDVVQPAERKRMFLR